MNALRGEIESFLEEDEISLVSANTALGEFSVLMLGFSQVLSAQKGSKIELLFKENELSLAKIGSQVSAENVFESKIIHIEKGKILWQVFLEYDLSSIITAKSGQKLNLHKDDTVSCFVKASDIIIKAL